MPEVTRKWECRVFNRDYMNEPILVLWHENFDGSMDFAESLTFKTYPKHHYFGVEDPPALFGRRKESHPHGHASEIIQAIVDAAHEAGFRPKGMEPVTNQLAATNRHLEDMRAIVSRTIACPLPGVDSVLDLRKRPGQ